MAICRFFLENNCKFGDRCKNEHPTRNSSSSSSSRNPFAPLQNNHNSTRGSDTYRGQPRGREPPPRDPPATSFKLSKTSIETDLTKETPQWILSSYGPGLEAPLQLFGGQPREQSFEELRLRHYILAAQGKEQQAIQEAQELVRNAEQQMRTALNDVDGAIKYIVDGQTQHPNRIDACNSKGTGPFQTHNISPNDQQSKLTIGRPMHPSPAFGLPTAASAFDRASVPTFGQTSAPGSAFGQAPAPVFGQPSAPITTFGQMTTSMQPPGLERPPTTSGQGPFAVFGKASDTVPAYDQAAALVPFGAPQQPSLDKNPLSVTPAFTNPGASRQSSQREAPGPFGQAPRSTPDRVFGQPSTPVEGGNFGRSSVSNPAQPTVTQVSKNTVEVAPLNPFVGFVAPASSDLFRRPSAAAPESKTVPSTSIGAGVSKESAQYPRGSTMNNVTTGIQTSEGIKGQRDNQGNLKTWNGRSVSYVNNEPCYEDRKGNKQRIWFPDGAPVFKKNYDLADEAYDERTKEDYRFLKQNGAFKEGIMPVLPPKKDWCEWAL